MGYALGRQAERKTTRRRIVILQQLKSPGMQEAGTGFASKPQTDDAEPGDIALDSWVRYDDPEARTFEQNQE